MPGQSFQIALHFGILTGEKFIFNKNTYFAGIFNGFVSRRHYYFSAIRYIKNSNHTTGDSSDKLQVDLAYGIRPYRTHYLKPDLVILMELNLRSVPDLDAKTFFSTSRTIVFLSPGILFSYRNIMIKSGIQIPVYNKIDGAISGNKTILVIGFEFRFPPIK